MSPKHFAPSLKAALERYPQKCSQNVNSDNGALTTLSWIIKIYILMLIYTINII